MLESLEQFKVEHLMIGLEGLKIVESTWTLDGWLRVRFGVGIPTPPDPEIFHELLDPWFDDVAGELPGEVAFEFKQFLKGMVTQFAALRKHALSLRRITFEDMQWVRHDVLQMRVKDGGKVMLPRDVGWD